MINKKKLVKGLSQRTVLSLKESEQVINELFSLIVDEVFESKEISITGFGKFYMYEHKPRPVRNPKTQKEMLLEPYKSLKFKPSSVVKQRFKDKSKK